SRPTQPSTLSLHDALPIYVGVQRRNRRDELLGLVPGDASAATWTIDCNAVESPRGIDLKGAYIQGPPGGRFIYLSWGTVDDASRSEEHTSELQSPYDLVCR